MHKGSRVGVDGRLEWREWETSDKHKRQAVSIVADTVQFLDGPRGDRAADGLGESVQEPGAEDRELAGVGADGKDLAF
jgi:single-strand DNA-binding protein